MIKPVMPTVADAFAHLLNYSEHMATVHYQNGKYHVHYEYIEAAKKNSHDNSPYSNILKKADSSNEHIMPSVPSYPSMELAFQDHCDSSIRYLPLITVKEDLRPPILFVS